MTLKGGGILLTRLFSFLIFKRTHQKQQLKTSLNLVYLAPEKGQMEVAISTIPAISAISTISNLKCVRVLLTYL